jgi:hypothetical protein
MSSNDLALTAELTEGYREHVYLGVSTESLSAAFENAWEYAKEEARRQGKVLPTPLTARVLAEWAIAENPFTNYMVVAHIDK